MNTRHQDNNQIAGLVTWVLGEVGLAINSSINLYLRDRAKHVEIFDVRGCLRIKSFDSIHEIPPALEV